MAERHWVGFETRKGPDFTSCGGFCWVVRFLIADASGGKQAPKQPLPLSWIIQHVVFKERITTCTRGEELAADDHDYWEGFRVGTDGWATDEYQFDFDGSGEKPWIQAGRDDIVSEPDAPTTCGWRTAELTAYWLEVLPRGSMKPSGLFHIKEAGGLPASESPPSGLDTAAWTLRRTVRLDWNCCSQRGECQTEPGTATGEATARNASGTYIETWSLDRQHRKTVEGVQTL